ncbi:MAG: mechanosensitive ion channel family protein [Candidatus Latescibacterota bacterium]
MPEETLTAADSLAATVQAPGTLAADLWTAAGILGGFLLVALVVRLLWMRLLRPLMRRSTTDLDDLLLPPLRVLTLWGLVLVGLHQAANSLEAVEARAQAAHFIDRMLSIAGVVLVLITLLRLFNRLVPWFGRRAASRSREPRDLSHELALVRKTGNVLLAVVGLLYVLRVAGVDISPLLAGGAIGGLAVALAAQDTLSNLFAGFFVTIDRPVKVGDYIRLESGEEGFVDEIGWRSTKVRLLANNVVIIPNAKLSQSIITNHFLPEPAVNVYVGCGVSYDSDLQHVEEVTLDAARQVLRDVPGADATWEPVVRWKEFGDFAITFVVVLRASDFNAQFGLHSEFVKALHRRFGDERIEIPYPIRTVLIRHPVPA